MLIIDGSSLEGGGQIVRMSVALSAMTGIPVRVERIRAGRDQPGLRPQHLAAVRAVAAACSAEVSGCMAGSRSLAFHPGTLDRNTVTIDISTAGSIPLVLQAWLPVSLRKGGSISLSGGTEVTRSPTIDYVAHVLIPLLGMHGAVISLDIQARGYYPRGGGVVQVCTEPSRLRPLHPELCRDKQDRGICSCSTGLPGHVAERQARSAASFLSHHTGLDFPLSVDAGQGPGTGSSCTAWMGWMGGSAIGKRGVSAENVGEAAALALIGEMKNGGMVDAHLADQLLVYLAMAGGGYTCHTCTLHARTVCWLLSQFGIPVTVCREGDLVRFEYAASP